MFVLHVKKPSEVESQHGFVMFRASLPGHGCRTYLANTCVYMFLSKLIQGFQQRSMVLKHAEPLLCLQLCQKDSPRRTLTHFIPLLMLFMYILHVCHAMINR